MLGPFRGANRQESVELEDEGDRGKRQGSALPDPPVL